MTNRTAPLVTPATPARALTVGDRVVYEARNGHAYEATIIAERMFDCTISGPVVGMVSASYARLTRA